MMFRKSISHETKKEVWDKCEGRCWYCGKPLNPFFIHYDHVVPHSKGGEDTIENLVTACPPCNHSKKDFALWEWRVKLSKEFSMNKIQVGLLKSEGIDYFENPYNYDPVLLFYFERDEPNKRLPELGYQPYSVIINHGGWTR